MAVIETWLKQDADSLVEVVPLKGNLFYEDNGGNLIGVEVTRAGAAVSLPARCHGYVILSNGFTEYVEGSVSGNKAWITLPLACYSQVGPISIVIKVGASIQNNKPVGGATVLACTGYVYKTRTDEVVDPGDVLPSLDDLLDAIDDCQAATADAEKVNATIAKSGHVVTVTVTDRTGHAEAKTLQEPFVTVATTQSGYKVSLTDSGGTEEFDVIPTPNQAIAPLAHAETVSRSKTRTGNPIMITDAAAEIADKLQIRLEPAQDLHGYSKPWVGGAGKNKANVMVGNNNDMYSTKVNGKLSVSGTSSGDPAALNVYAISVAPNTSYKFVGKRISGTTNDIRVRYRLFNGATAVSTSANEWWRNSSSTYSRDIALGSDAVDRMEIQFIYSKTESANNAVYECMVILGSETDETWEPYSNICPITGYDAVTARRRVQILTPNDLTLSTGRITETGETNTSNTYRYTEFIPVKSGEKVRIKAKYSKATSHYYGRCVYDENYTPIPGYIFVDTKSAGDKEYDIELSIPTGGKYFRMSGVTEEFNEYFSIETGYESYPITLSTASRTVSGTTTTAGTVYGGNLVLNRDGSGSITVDRRLRTFVGTENWKYSTGCFYLDIDSDYPKTSDFTAVSNFYEVYGLITGASSINTEDQLIGFYNGGTSSLYRIYVVDNRLETTADAYKAFLAEQNLQVAYKLATPITYNLTANQVQTLLGYNYIYADAGIITLDYRQEKYVEESTVLGLLPTGTATGNPITISDGAKNVPLKKLQIAIEPKQDLHGFTKPWVGGAGKNLIPWTIDGLKAANTSGTWSGNTYTKYNVSFAVETDSAGNVIGIKVNGTNSHTSSAAVIEIPVNIPAGTYTLTGIPSGSTFGNDYIGCNVTGTTKYLRANTTGLAIELVTTSEQHTGSVWIGVNAAKTVSNLAYKPPMIRLSTTSDTWEPYTNICPISGWDEVHPGRAGKNLVEQKLSGCYVDSNGTIGSNSQDYSSFIARVKKGKTYSIIKQETSLVCGFFTSKPASGARSYNNSRTVQSNTSTFIAPIDGWVCVRSTNGDVNVQIEMASASTTYEPFVANEDFPITLPTTVYGGSLILDEHGDGTLVADLARAYITNVSAIIRNADRVFTVSGTYLPGIKSVTTVEGLYCDKLKSELGADYQDDRIYVDSSTTGCRIRTSGYFASAELMFASLGNSLEIVYPLATPITYTLTANQIRTLLGSNTIWADCGAVSIEYGRDIGSGTEAAKTAVLSIVAESETGTATANHSVGDLFVLNGILYKTIVAISTGETITPGTNCSSTTLEAEISAKANAENPVFTESISMGRMANTTVGTRSTAVGYNVTASGTNSHAEGGSTKAEGSSSHAEGIMATASGAVSHAEGYNTVASGAYSHAEGYNAVASGENAHAEGFGTIAQRAVQHVFGKFNALDSTGTATTALGKYVEIVGGGNQDMYGQISRVNIRTLDWYGNEWLAGSLKIGNTELTEANLQALLALLN